MDHCDILIVGGGPAGSTCAWQLRKQGFDVVVMDKAAFPRDKTCAGWIVPQVIESLQLDVAEYAARHVWQPITGFQIGLVEGPGTTIQFDQVVSYGIRRCEFDHYLLERSGVRLRLGQPVRSIANTETGWVINDELKTNLVIGAGGNFCPVARMMRAEQPNLAPLVTAVEAEFPLAGAPVNGNLEGEIPRLYFCDDLAGYGWCVRKQTVLNVGIGRVDARDVPAHWDRMLARFRSEQILTGELPQAVHGHAYHVYSAGHSPLVGDRVLLIGDAAGLADPRSGEGIRPAIESGLLAADVVHQAEGRYDRSRLRPYAERILQRFGRSQQPVRSRRGVHRPNRWRSLLSGWLIRNRWFGRQVILKRWFLHAQQPAMRAG